MRYDGKTGLVDLNARWYNPTAGKFMNEDTYPGVLSQPQTQNRYSYALNNPVNMWDPSGHVAVPVDQSTGGIPHWVRSQSDYDYVEDTGGLHNYYHYWDFIDYSETKSDTRLVNEVMELRGYNQTYQKDVSNTWTYGYKKIETINKNGDEFPTGEVWKSTETFNESYTEEWFDFISAEEIAGQNAEEIAKYGAPANAKMLGIKINRPAAFDNFVERERNKHLIQVQPKILSSTNNHNINPFTKSLNSFKGIGEGLVRQVGKGIKSGYSILTKAIDKVIITKEEHYARNEINEKRLKEMNVTVDEIINYWNKAKEDEDVYHENTSEFNNKYWSPDGHVEVVINEEDKNNPFIVTDPRDMGTYNIRKGVGPGHIYYDMLPYWIWGNTPNDPTAFRYRVAGPYYGSLLPRGYTLILH